MGKDTTNYGRIDLSLDVLNYYILLEFKLVSSGNAASAIEQIKMKQYIDKYKTQNKPICLIGISFDPQKRNIHDFASEIIN